MSNVMTQTEAQAMVEDILAYERGGEPLTEWVEKFWAPVLEKAMGVKMSPRDSKVVTSAFIDYFRTVLGEYVADWKDRADFVVTRTKEYKVKDEEDYGEYPSSQNTFTFPERFSSKGKFEFDIRFLEQTHVGRMIARLLGQEALEALKKNMANAMVAEGKKFLRFATEAIKQYFAPSGDTKEYFHDDVYSWFEENKRIESLIADRDPDFALTLNSIKISPNFKMKAGRAGPVLATDVEVDFSVKVTDVGVWTVNPDYHDVDPDWTSYRARRRWEDAELPEGEELEEAKGSPMEKHAVAIYKMTDWNDHSGARLYLAEKVLKDKKLTTIAKAIQTIHDQVGSMPTSLSQFRDVDFLRMLEAAAKRKLSSEDYNLIMQSF